MPDAKSKIAEYELNNLLSHLSKKHCYSDELKQINDNPAKGKCYLGLASELEKNEEYLNAIKILKHGIEVEPLMLFAYVRMAVCYYKLNDKSKCHLSLSHAYLMKLQHEKQSQTTYLPLLQCLSNDYLPSESNLKVSDRSLAEPMYDLGIFCLNSKYLSGAEICYRVAIEIDPSHSYALANLGSCLCQKGTYDEAFSCMIRSLEVNPNDKITLNGLAYSLLLNDFPYLASGCAKKAVDIDSQYMNAQNMLKLSTVAEDISYFRQQSQNFWMCHRASTLIVNKEAKTAIENAERLMFCNNDKSNNSNSSIVLSIGAGVEKELKESFTYNIAVKYNIDRFKTNLGDMARFFSDRLVNLLTYKKTYNNTFNKDLYNHTKVVYLYDDDDMSLIANSIHTIAFLRNSAAHGESIDNIRTKLCFNVLQALILNIARGRINKAIGEALPFSMHTNEFNGVTIKGKNGYNPRLDG